MKVSASALQGIINAVQAAGMAHGITIECLAEECTDHIEVSADLTPVEPGRFTIYSMLTIRIHDLARDDWGNRRAIEHHVTKYFRRAREDEERTARMPVKDWRL